MMILQQNGILKNYFLIVSLLFFINNSNKIFPSSLCDYFSSLLFSLFLLSPSLPLSLCSLLSSLFKPKTPQPPHHGWTHCYESRQVTTHSHYCSSLSSFFLFHYRSAWWRRDRDLRFSIEIGIWVWCGDWCLGMAIGIGLVVLVW